ncbi:MAG TPA: DUF6691 family protein [Sediminibacterium sp.]|nr:DUF6691 family protein [Sediminibacterium sp.]
MNTKQPVSAYQDLEIADTEATAPEPSGFFPLLKYTIAGIIFGIILTKSEVISWYRIQEMFRLESFHMYGVIGSAVITGIISVWLIKKLRLKTMDGTPIHIAPKSFHKGQIIGGCLFGFGWAMTGACPGPLFAILGTGVSVILVSIFFAVIGTWLYGKIQTHLPH